MSLAATLSADGMRPASFLPAIKCSDCGQEIEIARMGDHVCGSRGQLPAALTPGAPRARATPPPPLANPYTMPSWGTSNQQYQPPSPTSRSPINTRMPTASFAPSPLAQAQAPPAIPQTHPVGLTPASRLPPPPRINADVANAPFLAPQFPNSVAPPSPIGSVRSGRSGSSNSSRPPNLRALMNLPSPLVRNRSPSPDYAPNLDCAFPSFPTTSSNAGSRPGTSNGRSTPNSERAPSRAGSRARSRVDRETHNMEPRSPRTTAGGDILKRANTLKSGPFDAGRRTGSREETPPMPKPFAEEQRRPSDASERPQLSRQASNFSQSQRRPSEPTEKPALSPLPEATSATLQPFAFGERRPSDSSGRPSFSDDERGPHSRNGSPPPADFFAHRGRSPLTAQDSASVPAPLRIGDRSKTFPAPSEQDRPPLGRTETEPATRGRRPSLASNARSDRSFPVRSSSRSRTRIDTRAEDIPPVPKPVQQYRQLSKHAPSESASSASSTTRPFSNANSSEGPSPVGSAASSIDAFSPISQANVYEKEERPKSERMRSAGYSTKKEQRNPGLRAEQPAQRSPPPNFARPRPSIAGAAGLPSMAALVESPADSQGLNKHDTPQQQHQQQHGFDWGLPASTPARSVSPMKATPPTRSEDTWTSGWANLAPTTTDDYDPYRAPSPNPAARSRSKSNASSIYPTDERRPSMPPPMPSDATMPRALSRRNTTARAPCRGCGEVIEGKSVKAADGRLTGRWHKHCFTCQTCRQPFATADFYVINNQPYCKQHWHEQNGSVCYSCKRGIEGQYLETSASGPEKKYHPTCFTCHECRLILSNDYVEVGGHAYCERHAMQAMRGPPPRSGGPGAYGRGGYGTPSGLHPGRREMMGERRTTKLMMM